MHWLHLHLQHALKLIETCQLLPVVLHPFQITSLQRQDVYDNLKMLVGDHQRYILCK